MSNLLLAPKSTPSVAKEQFLQLNLAEEIFLLITKPIREIMTISAEQIMPIPHLSSWVMGVFNYRSESLWLLDLGALIGFTPLYRQASPTSSYTLVVLQFDSFEEDRDCQLGLVVNRVGNIERWDLSFAEARKDRSGWQDSLFTINSQLGKFLQGYWLKSEQEIFPVLNPDAIFQLSVEGKALPCPYTSYQ